MRILITGSTGFIGGSLGRFAARAGHEVIGIARRSQPDANWPGRHVAADVAQADLAGIFKDIQPDAIFHGAGTASVGASLAFPLDDLRAAVMTFAHVLDGVRRSGTRPLVIFPSSAAVYGNPARLPVAEDAPTSPISPYGFHKLSCETLAREYVDCFGLDTLVCRVFSVFGPAQRRLLVWEIFQQLSGQGQSVRLQGSGRESRDYLHADDLAAGILAFAKKRPKGFNVFNLASGCEMRICEIASEMGRIVGSAKRIEYLNHHASGDPTCWGAEMSRTRGEIPDWQPQSFLMSLTQCIDQWRSICPPDEASS